MTAPAGKLKKKELIDIIQALEDKINALVAAFNDHTHKADGAQAGAFFTSVPTHEAATAGANIDLGGGEDEVSVAALDLSA